MWKKNKFSIFPIRFFPKKSLLLTISLLTFLFLSSHAQELDKLFNDTATVNAAQVTQTAPPIMAQNWNQWQTKFFTLNLGFAILLDHNILIQDDSSIAQVGDVKSATQFRGDRLILSGTFFASKKYPWRYMISVNYNGLDAPPDKKFDFVDWNIEIPFSAKAGWLTLGKQKEGVSLEYIAPGTQMQFMERATGAPMLVRQRNIGIRYSNSVLDHRLFYTFGFFNNYWETGKSFSANGSQYAGRIAGLPRYKSDRDLLHLGIGFRYSDDTEGKLSYKARPEANTAPYFINTGSFKASGSNTLFLEMMMASGPVLFVGEYANCSIKGTDAGNLSIGYYHVGASWFLTGENRRYNRTVGNPGKVIPKKNFKFRNGSGPGAFELGARYSKADATDVIIRGGEFGRFTTALSWYPNSHFRYELNWGKGRLDKDDKIGKTSFWQFRMQYEL